MTYPRTSKLIIGVLADFDHAVLVSDLIAPEGSRYKRTPMISWWRAEHPRVVEEETPEEDEELEGEEAEGEEGEQAAEEESRE